jgi:Multiubiquitin
MNEKAAKKVEITVNGRPVAMPKEEATGLEIKQAAIDQNVPIELSFILQLELPNGDSQHIGDSDVVKLKEKLRFTAIANDDNS